MHLPFPIQAYFDSDQRRDGEALVQTFAPDAIVKDEGNSYAGHTAIREWWRATKDKYQTVLEPLAVDEEEGTTTVRARATGRFPGSPATISFTFRLEGDRISRLDIGA